VNDIEGLLQILSIDFETAWIPAGVYPDEWKGRDD